jgi:hypothetical protein
MTLFISTLNRDEINLGYIYNTPRPTEILCLKILLTLKEFFRISNKTYLFTEDVHK